MSETKEGGILLKDSTPTPQGVLWFGSRVTLLFGRGLPCPGLMPGITWWSSKTLLIP